MNRQKIVVAGLVAGLVLNVLNFLSGSFVTGHLLKDALDAVNPSLMPAMSSGRAATVLVVGDFILGIVIVWIYAAMRPRYGAGPRNALMSAFFVWVVSAVAYLPFHAMGLMGLHLWLLFCVTALVCFAIAALVGGKLYSE